MDNFAFTPTEGFRNGTSFPDPSTETEAREQLQRLHDQTRDFINGIVGAVNDNASNITSLETRLTEDINDLETMLTGDINSIRRVYFGTCSTADGTGSKIIATTLSNFELKTGNLLVVYFSQPNTHETGVSLKVDGLSAKSIASPSNTNQKDSITWISGVVAFIYDGEKFRIVNRPIGDIETYGMVKLSDAVDSASESSHGRTAATPYAVKKVKDSLDTLRTFAETTAQKAETLEDECSLIRDDLDAKADVTALWETNRNINTNTLAIDRLFDDLHDIFPEHTRAGQDKTSFTGANYIRLGGSNIYGNQIATKDYVDSHASSTVWWGTCSTVRATEIKVVTTTTGDFALNDGNVVNVFFNWETNTTDVYLDVDGTGSKKVYWGGSTNVTGLWNIYALIGFKYDSTKDRYIPLLPLKGNNNHYGIVKVDPSPISGSSNAIESGAVYSIQQTLTNKVNSCYTKTETDTLLSAKQNTSNLVTSISASSTDAQYPSAKCVYDLIGNVESLLSSL